MPEIQKTGVAATEEQATTTNMVVDCLEDAPIGQIVSEAIRDWQCKRGLRNKQMERLPKV